MGEMAPEQPQGPGQVFQPDQPTQPVAEPGDNERWNGFLKDIPTAFHTQFKNQLKEWDKQVNGKFQEIHQQYEPYKQFREAKVAPDQIQYGLQLMELLENRPWELYQALAEVPQVAQQLQQATGEPIQEYDDEGGPDPKYQQLEQIVGLMAEKMLQEGQKSSDAHQDSLLQQEIDQATQKYGPGSFDLNYVLQYAYANESSIEDAVQAFNNMKQQILTNSNRPGAVAPNILSGGGVPSSHVDTSKISDKQRRDMAVQFLENAKRQQG